MAPTFPTTVEHWPLDRLIPDALNARTHSEEQVAQMCQRLLANAVIEDYEFTVSEVARG